MGVTAKLRKVGGSTMVAIPPRMLEDLAIGQASEVDLSVENGVLHMKPTRPKYTLAELLAQCDWDAPPAERDEEWLAINPVGREII